MRRAAALLLVAGACGHKAAPPPRVTLPPRVVDLTHPFDERTLYWPTSPTGFQRETLSFGKTPSGFFYTSGRYGAPEHGGTHLDAPIHFAERGATAEAVPLERLAGPAVVVDLRRAQSDPDALLSPADVTGFEKRHGRIEPGTLVLVRTGWADRWPDRRRYLGDDTPGDASRLHFPGVSAEAARLLVERNVAAVGIDTASIDHGPSRDFMAHQVLSAAGVPIFENVASMAALPPRGALVIALPMKIAAGSGAPLRIVAYLP
jgi:kynurenine formamidase